MALPVPEQGRKGLLSFRLFGFPVTIHTSFLVIVVLLGYTDDAGVGGALMWAVVVTVSVLAHELGHALVAAPAGGEPRIDLYMLAGLTTWRPHRAGRGRRVAVSVAGPFAGVVFGIGLLFLDRALQPPEGTLLYDALGVAVYVNLAWGLLNLLPMLPLDGGQVVLSLMPGRDEVTRLRRASYASLGVAAAVAVAAIAVGAPLAAAVVVFFGAGNAQRVLALRRGEDPAARLVEEAEAAMRSGRADEALLRLPDVAALPPHLRPAGTVVRAASLLRLDRTREAQDLLLDLPPGVLDPVFEATVLWANGQERLARERLAAALQQDPAPWAVRELVLLLRRRGEDVVGVVGGVTGLAASGVLDALFETGDYEAAAAWGERALATGGTDPAVAYNTACSHANAGDSERALRALGYAATLGWNDVAMAERDPDLAAVRALPPWPEVRAAMAANEGAGASYRPLR